MFIKNKNCEKCGVSYDPVLESCPRCHEHNEDIEKLGIPQNIFWLDYPLQILLFVLGFLFGGMLLINSFYDFCFQQIADEEFRHFLSLCSTYVTLFAIGVGICCFNLKGVRKFLANYKSYLWGLIFMIVLFGLSLILGFITNQITDEVNQNQTAVELYMHNYPVVSILVLGIVGPIVEELTYRVGLFSFLRRLNRVAAYVVTILLFALIHFSFDMDNIVVELVNLPSYLLAGAVLTVAYDFFGPVTSITAHVVYNILSLLMVLWVK